MEPGESCRYEGTEAGTVVKVLSNVWYILYVLVIDSACMGIN